MSRSLSSAAKQAANARETGEAFLFLLTITHALLPATLRFTNNRTDIVSRGDTYVAFPFQVTLPDDDPEEAARVQLRIDNVDRQIVDNIKLLTSPPAMTLEIVLGSTPNTVEAGPVLMELTKCDYNALTVTGDLAFEPVLFLRFPSGRFTPASHPGLF